MRELLQLHWQFKDGTTDMRAQKSVENYEEFHNWIKEIKEDQPLPEDAVWLMVQETSRDFVKTSVDNKPRLL